MQKKVLVLNAQVDFWGASRSCLTSVIAMKEAGYDVLMMATWHGPIEKLVVESGVRFDVCPYGTWMTWPGNKKERLLGKIKRFVFVIKDIICDFFRMKKKLDDLSFIPDLIYSNTIMQPLGLMLSAFYKVPHVYHIREYGKADFGMHFTLGDSISYYLANKYTVLSLCISKGVQNEWKKCFGEKAVLLYNGVEFPIVEYKRHKKSGNGLKIIVVGRLSVEKGQRDVLKALAIAINKVCPRIFVDFYGEGVDLDYLIEMSNRLDITDYIRFCGFSQNIPYDEYNLAIMSSHSEGFGRTTLEYMLNGVPVIGYDGGATPELVREGNTGRLFHDEEELANLIGEVYKNYDVFEGYAKKAYDMAINEFSIEIYKKNLIQIISGIDFRNE